MTNQPKPTVQGRYTNALDSGDPVSVLRKTPKRLRKLLKSAKPKELAWKADDATWSVHEVIGHLADSEFVFGARVRFVAAEDRPLLPAYDEKRFQARLGIERATLEDLFDSWIAARAANVHLLDRLPETAWSKVGLHAERGELSLMQIVVGGAGHDRVHEEQIERTIARARAARRELKTRERDAKKAAKAAKRPVKHVPTPAEQAAAGRAAKKPKRAKQSEAKKSEKSSAKSPVGTTG
jgi:hypothetical protein